MAKDYAHDRSGLHVLAQAPVSGSGPLWIMQKDSGRVHAELRDETAQNGGGAELRLFVNGRFIHGLRHPSRQVALADAEACRKDLESDGWHAGEP
jgi:hypothetical protein